MTYGTVTAMLQLVNQVQGPFASLSNTFPKFYNMIASAERLIEICDLPDEEEINAADIDVEKTYSALTAIAFNDISFRYDRDIILDNTSLSIKRAISLPSRAFRASAKARCSNCCSAFSRCKAATLN